ncbi:hypothetical protein CALVIDRAFT_491526, partial [Calocera viscosa TUFC12733]
MTTSSTPLIAIFLVATCSSGTFLVFRWPPYPRILHSPYAAPPLPTTKPTRTSRAPTSSKTSSPSSKDRTEELFDEQAEIKDDYQTVFDFDDASTFAEILAPARELCYQKFKLIVDDLAFVGHPVCVARDGVW